MRSLPVVVAGLVIVAGCGGPSAPEVTPGPSAADPGCARLLGRLPPRLLGIDRSPSPARGAAAWNGVVLRCGVTPSGPTSTTCIETDGIDWLFTETPAAYRFTTYGREPAVEVSVPADVPRTRAVGAMTGLTDAVRPITQSRRCL